MSDYISEDVLEEFYKNLVSGGGRRIHIPRSEVFYVRVAIEADTGIRYSLDHVERAMLLEGFLDPDDCFEPDKKRPGIG